MTEKEKMEKGMLYYADKDEQLKKERMLCKDKCYAYNQLKPSQIEEKREIIMKLFGKTTENFTITAPFWCDYGHQIEVGDCFYTNHNCVMLDCAKITFGDYVFIAPNCCFTTAGHPIDYERRDDGLEFAYPITVGSHVWFGANVTVLPGVTIGDNVVIGSGSVVNKNVPSGVVAAGNPCRVIREITESDKDNYWTRSAITIK